MSGKTFSSKTFIDTNVLIYAYNLDALERTAAAQQMVAYQQADLAHDMQR